MITDVCLIKTYRHSMAQQKRSFLQTVMFDVNTQ